MMMQTFARLEPEDRWPLWDAGTPRNARILCGKRSPDDVQRCRAYLALFYFPTDVSLPQVILEGMRLQSDGVYRPTKAALAVLMRLGGTLSEPNGFKRESHLGRHPHEARKRYEETAVYLPEISIIGKYRAVCPRCRKEQILLGTADIDKLRNAMQQYKHK